MQKHFSFSIHSNMRYQVKSATCVSMSHFIFFNILQVHQFYVPNAATGEVISVSLMQLLSLVPCKMCFYWDYVESVLFLLTLHSHICFYSTDFYICGYFVNILCNGYCSNSHQQYVHMWISFVIICFFILLECFILFKNTWLAYDTLWNDPYL